MASNWKATAVPGVHVAGTRLAYHVKVPSKRDPAKLVWRYVKSGYVLGQEVEAGRALERAKRAEESGQEIVRAKGKLTLRTYCEEKFFPRRQLLIEDWRSDERRLEHVLPFSVDGTELWGWAPNAIRTRHLADAFLAFRQKVKPNGAKYAPKSIWNTYGVVQALFRDLIRDEHVFSSPCLLTELDLGPNVDADSEWREGAYFEREEAEILMWSPLIPWDRRVWYALSYLAALRLGESAALRFRHWMNAEPLDFLLVAKSHGKEHTKTKRPRRMPIHPLLSTFLTEWKLKGWPAMMGRHPQPDDLVCPVSAPNEVVEEIEFPSAEGSPILTVDQAAELAEVDGNTVRKWLKEGRLPSLGTARLDSGQTAVQLARIHVETFLRDRKAIRGKPGRRLPVGAMRTEKYVSSRIKADLSGLGLRHRRGHDLRATFITWALADGAAPIPLKSCTHTPRSQSAFDQYNRIPYSTKAEAVAHLKVAASAPARGELVPLARAASGLGGKGKSLSSFNNDDQPFERLATRLLPISATSCDSSKTQLEAAGIEPASVQQDTSQQDASAGFHANESASLSHIYPDATAGRTRPAQAAGSKVASGPDPTELALSVALDHWRHAQDVEVLCAQLEELLGRLGGGR